MPAPITIWLALWQIGARPAARQSVYARKSKLTPGRTLAISNAVAVILLALFPFLLMVDTRVAWVAMATAIALICGKRFSAPRRPVPRPIDHDASV